MDGADAGVQIGNACHFFEQFCQFCLIFFIGRRKENLGGAEGTQSVVFTAVNV